MYVIYDGVPQTFHTAITEVCRDLLRISFKDEQVMLC